jgi:hypothetical protein
MVVARDSSVGFGKLAAHASQYGASVGFMVRHSGQTFPMGVLSAREPDAACHRPLYLCPDREESAWY